MDELTRTEMRKSTERLRRPPGTPITRRVRFEGDGRLEELRGENSAEVILEVTDADGELAAWFNDFWWTERIQQWGDQPFTIHIAPTPAALLHVVVLHQLEMIRRVVPTWRLIGHGYRDDVVSGDAVAQAAAAPYDELRIIDAARRSSAPLDQCTSDAPLGEIFARIRREQQRIAAVRPILIRLPSPASASAAHPVSAVIAQPVENRDAHV
jgi:hypothetical protein